MLPKLGLVVSSTLVKHSNSSAVTKASKPADVLEWRILLERVRVLGIDDGDLVRILPS